jgi:hypothetical protein
MNKVRQCYAEPLRVPYKPLIEQMTIIGLLGTGIPILGLLGVIAWDVWGETIMNLVNGYGAE